MSGPGAPPSQTAGRRPTHPFHLLLETRSVCLFQSDGPWPHWALHLVPKSQVSRWPRTLPSKSRTIRGQKSRLLSGRTFMDRGHGPHWVRDPSHTDEGGRTRGRLLLPAPSLLGNDDVRTANPLSRVFRPDSAHRRARRYLRPLYTRVFCTAT